jgi:signal transduction histidine kinase
MLVQAIGRSIRYKFALVVLAATFTALAVAGSALVAYELRTYQQNGMSDLLTQADILGRATAPALAFDDPKSANEYLALLKAKPQIRAAAIYNARGKVVADYLGADGPPANVPALPDADGVRVQGNELVVFKRIVENKEIVGTVYMSANYELTERLKNYLGILAVVMALSLLVAMGMSAWLQTALTKPILAVTRVARQVMERRDFSLRVQKTTQDELGYLVDAFNAMLSEVGRRAEALETANRSLEREAAERQRADEDVRQLNAELERRVLERTAQFEAANKELEGFSYSVSHDLRAPLRWIVGFSDALMEDHGPELDEEAQRKISVIRNEGKRMGMLIDDLLAFSRLGRKALQTVEVNMVGLAQTCWNALKAQQEESAARVDIRIDALPQVHGDRVLLGQVLTNLLSNALKFGAKQAHPRIEVSAITDENEHIYFVRDNGAGFDPKYQAKLFGVFQRLHDANDFPGTGVGLALVQRIVNRHGGRVWAEGKPGEGATFYFTLPKERKDGSI